MLRVALPNGGKYAKPVRKLVERAGYRQRKSATDLTVYDSASAIEFVYLEPRDIPAYVGSGLLQLGFSTTVVAEEAGVDVHCLLELDLGAQSLRVAVPTTSAWTLDDLKGRRVASRFPMVTRQFLARQRLHADIIKLDGGVPVAVRLGLSDAIVDVVKDESHLRAQYGLTVIGEPVLGSHAVLIRRTFRPDREEPAALREEMDGFVRRIRGVTFARRFVMLDYNCPKAKVDEAMRLAPGTHSPTYSTMKNTDWFAIRVMIKRSDLLDVVEALRGIGCDAIAATRVDYCGLEGPTATA